MAIIETVTVYEVLARWTPEGLAGCQMIEAKRFTDDATGEVLGETLAPAVAVTPEVAADLIAKAVKVPEPQQ